MTHIMVSSSGRPVPPPPRVIHPYDPINTLGRTFGTDRDPGLKVVTHQRDTIKGAYPAPEISAAPNPNTPSRELGPILSGGSSGRYGGRNRSGGKYGT
jgi:hypothetical protein